jgi:hypothetical protein
MKIEKPRIPNKEKTTSLQKEQPAALVRILEAKENEGQIYLRVAMSREFHCELHEFLKQKGYVFWGREKEGMSLLLESGLSEEDRSGLEKNQSEMSKESSCYAAMTFQTAEYYARNTAITLGLNLHLQKNRALKKELKEKGLGEFVPADEWDKWDEDFIDVLYRRYVFHK